MTLTGQNRSTRRQLNIRSYSSECRQSVPARPYGKVSLEVR